MGYLGNEPTTGHFPVQTNLVGPGPTYTLDRAPASAGAIEVSVAGVLQPTTSYSVSGTTLTMAGVASSIPIFIRYLGETLILPTIADGVVVEAKIGASAVTTSKIANTAVTLAKMAANSVDSDAYVDGSIDTAHIANDAVTTAKIINNAVDETKLKDALVADFTEVVVTAADSLLLGDATDSGNTKRDTVQGILDLAVHTGNVAFPATQVASADANTLDDYEQGSWTPVWGDGTNVAPMYAGNTGRYVKIGQLVYAIWYGRSSSAGSCSGSFRVNGLPFSVEAVGTSGGMYPGMVMGYFHHANITAGYSIYGMSEPNATHISLFLNDNSVGVTGLTWTEASSDFQIQGSITYKANA